MVYGFHAVGVHLKTAPLAIQEVWFDPTRRDARMRQFLLRAQEAGVRLTEADGLRLSRYTTLAQYVDRVLGRG